MTVALLAAALAAGLALQRAHPHPSVLRVGWTFYFWTLTPALVFYSFTTLAFDAGLTRALIAAVIAAWLVLGLGLAYAHVASRDPAERGVLALAGGMANTAFAGYPLAQLAFGQQGLALMVVYDRLTFLVPSLAVANVVARAYGRHASGFTGSLWRDALVNPPLLVMVVAVALRAADVDVPGVERLGDIAGGLVGPVGFFLLGLALPLERIAHAAPELLRAAGALAIRFGASPLALVLCGLALGAHIPRAFVLGAAMPCAFHLLILARVFGLHVNLARLLVVASTIPAVAIVAGIALL